MKGQSTSERIRELARAGTPVAEIARRLSIRYQHAYKVCRDAGIVPAGKPAKTQKAGSAKTKPQLSVEHLLDNGFVSTGIWTLQGARITCSDKLPQSAGVYAYAIDGIVLYVGLASGSLAKRLYFYGNPGATQRTNIRLNGLIREALGASQVVQVLCAQPPSFSWNGLRVSGPEGLEAALISDFKLPWNVRGAR